MNIVNINVFSEIEKLKKVLVHTPGNEIKYLDPFKLNKLLFSAIINQEVAYKEHKKFVRILEANDVEVIELLDLCSETFDLASEQTQQNFINSYVEQANKWDKKIKKALKVKVIDYLNSIKDTKFKIAKMMGGIFYDDINVEHKYNEPYIINAMPNLYFTRDPFSSIGSGIIFSSMKYNIRKRELIFSKFIFQNHPNYKQNTILFDSQNEYNIEGGDIFVYNHKTLVIGISERTDLECIQKLAQKLSDTESSFEKIYAIQIPKMNNLMHLDTMLTMIDYNKFIVAPYVSDSPLHYEIQLLNQNKTIQRRESISALLKRIIKQKPIIIYVGGKNANYLERAVETHFDATNYLVIKPGVVVGYDRNKLTQKALEENGVIVHSFEGNQLSLGMGSTRCMSMPLVRGK